VVDSQAPVGTAFVRFVGEPMILVVVQEELCKTLSESGALIVWYVPIRKNVRQKVYCASNFSPHRGSIVVVSRLADGLRQFEWFREHTGGRELTEMLKDPHSKQPV